MFSQSAIARHAAHADLYEERDGPTAGNAVRDFESVKTVVPGQRRSRDSR